MLIIYFSGIALHLLGAIIQSRMIASGVTQVERYTEDYEDGRKMHNSFLGLEWMPTEWLMTGSFWFLAWPVVLIGQFIYWLDNPKAKKNKLIKEAEEQGLELKEFVKKRELRK